MIYTLTKEEEDELLEQKRLLPTTPTNMSNSMLHVSGSSWGKDHLKALRVLHLDDLPLERFFDAQYLPNDSHPIYSQAAKEITDLSEDDIRSLSMDSFPSMEKNPFNQFFLSLSEAVSTKPATMPVQNREPSTGSVSSSGDEDKGEDVARACLRDLLGAILCKGAMARLNANWSLRLRTTSQRNRVWLGRQNPINVDNDGGIVFQTIGSHSGSARIGEIPVVSFEAKRRHVGGKTHGSGEAEEFDEDSLGQEVAELLSQVMTSCMEAHGGQWKDQDSWCLSIHGTEIRPITAHFDEMYLKMINGIMMRPSQRLVVFRSQPFNLKYDDERPLAVKAIIALLNWLKSGQSEQAVLMSVLADG